MRVEGRFDTRAPVDRVYALFRDPVAFTNCLDDPHQFRAVDADHFEGQITTGVAFIRGTFRLRGSYASSVPNQKISAHVTGTGMGSGLDADLEIGFATGPDGTSVSWSAEIVLSGPAATIGERMVRGTVDKKAGGLFENARRALEGTA